MNYSYVSKSSKELESLAEGFLAPFFSFRVADGSIVPDIEWIIEKSGISIIPRPGLAKRTRLLGYVPRVDGIVLVDAELSEKQPRVYRFTLAEEIAHRLIEPDLWAQGVPKGANIFELDRDIFDSIEHDAFCLSLALLMPKQSIEAQSTALRQELTGSVELRDLDWLLVERLADIFEVPLKMCAARCRHLKICSVDIKSKVPVDAIVF